MKIVTYATGDGDIPAAHRAIARIMLNDGSWHPVLITGTDEAAVRERATTWWGQELARHAPKTPKKKPKAVEAPCADPGDVI